MPTQDAAAAPTGEGEAEWENAVHEAGLRMTEPRRRVLQALEQLGHATPEVLVAHLSAQGSPLPASTVYRNLESLARAGLVRHSHMHEGVAAYHLPTHGQHLHLVCRECGRVIEAAPDLARDLARNLHRAHGFDADVTHMAIDGRCSACREERIS
ncbi:MAG TPA: Fur family transcriptional regulator [Ornithinimicrobium sp.]|uniref:Fur family transcriptional regulator n=1 Tax=Ornithinimicrobium sp. TaxID=1977084 RepID=UPI002B486B82|nr:Fur family transcriptional regulator [Ornithinimicrobium sp.]HKJ12973.1 Fur family transcriptional regulator [Ornithinimicrobium sp.]